MVGDAQNKEVSKVTPEKEDTMAKEKVRMMIQSYKLKIKWLILR